MVFNWYLLSSVVLTGTLTGFTSHAGATTGRAPLTLSLTHTTEVKVHDKERVLLSCGENGHKSVVLYWHTPFGQLHNPISMHGNQGPVTMRPDGSLEINNAGEHHQGIYYCLLQGGEGTTLHSYQLRMESEDISVKSLGQPQLGDSKKVRQRRNAEEVGPVSPDGLRKNAEIPDNVFAGAVAASVLLTFVLGFSVGALSSAPVLRCVKAVTKVRSLRRRGRRDPTGRGSGVVMDALPPAAGDDEAFQGPEEGRAFAPAAGRAPSASPPVKPQRSFRRERAEQAGTAAYLEGCDYPKGEEEEEKRRDSTGGSEANGVEVEGGKEERRDSTGESRDGTEERRDSTGERRDSVGERRDSTYSTGERKDRTRESRDGVGERRDSTGERGDSAGERRDRSGGRGDSTGASKDSAEKRRNSVGESRDSSGGSRDSTEESSDSTGERRNSAGGRGNDNNKDEGKRPSEKDDEAKGEAGASNSTRARGAEGSRNEDDEGEGAGGEEEKRTAPRPARRSRVIRLYQYDDEGQRYGHLPAPAPAEPVPAPRLKQRSLSLTRLNAIMAAAGASPLEPSAKENGREGSDREERPSLALPSSPGEKPVFSMDI